MLPNFCTNKMKWKWCSSNSYMYISFIYISYQVEYIIQHSDKLVVQSCEFGRSIIIVIIYSGTKRWLTSGIWSIQHTTWEHSLPAAHILAALISIIQRGKRRKLAILHHFNSHRINNNMQIDIWIFSNTNV